MPDQVPEIADQLGDVKNGRHEKPHCSFPQRMEGGVRPLLRPQYNTGMGRSKAMKKEPFFPEVKPDPPSFLDD